MNARNLFASLATAFLLALVFVPSGTATIQVSQDECGGIVDSSCFHCHSDGVCISCNNNGGYINLGFGQVGHLAGNHCWHG